MNVKQETAILVAKYLVRRAEEGVFGLLVRNLPPFDMALFLNEFREAQIKGTSFRLGLVGYDESLPTDHTVVGTTDIAKIVEWRNTTLEPKIVVVRESAPLLHSLNQFEQLKGEKLYRLVADEAAKNVGLGLLWTVLKRPRIRAFIPLEGLLSYYTALLNFDEKQRRFEAGRLLFLLGLLEDPDLFTDLAPARIVDRLEQNRFNVTRIARMNPVDRQRLTRALRLPEDLADLADTYERVMDYYRRPQETNLQGLTLENVKRLWQLPEEVLPVDTPTTPTGEAPDYDTLPLMDLSPIRELSATRAKETMDLLLNDDAEKRNEILYAHFEQLREHDKEAQENPNTDRLYQTQELFKRSVTESYWGGIFRLNSPQSEDESELTSLGTGQIPQRLRELYAYELMPFIPLSSDRPEWQLVERLERLVEEFDLDRNALDAFNRIQIARRILLLVIDQLVRYPLLTINSYLPANELEEELREKAKELGLLDYDGLKISLLRCGQLYLKAYNDLLRLLRQDYGQIAQEAPFGIEQFCSSILVLDTIIFELRDQYQALLSPLHPLYLWKYVELSTQTLISGATLNQFDQNLLKEQVDFLPNPVTTMYLSSNITDGKPKMLLETGSIDSLPYFEEYKPGSPGKTATNEISRIVKSYLALSPHAALGLRIAIVDAPDPAAIVAIMANLLRNGSCSTAYIRFLVTSGSDHVTQVPLLNLSNNDSIEQVIEGGYGTLNIEIDAQAQTYSELHDELDHQPVHLVLLFDPSKLAAVQIPRSFSILSPLYMPMKFHYDSLTDEVQIVPSADEGLFGYYNDIRNRLSGQLSGLTYGAKASLEGNQRTVFENLVKHRQATWLVVVDRPREQHEQFDLPRIALLPSGTRDVQVFASSLSRFEREFRLHLQKVGYEPNERAINSLVDMLGSLVPDGLLSLITRSRREDGLLLNFDAPGLQSALNILVAANWYYENQYYRDNGCLLVGLDSQATRSWFRLRTQSGRAHFVGLAVDSADDSQLYLDLLEVKTVDDRSGYRIEHRMIGRTIAGEDVRQLLDVADILTSIFRLTPQSSDDEANLLIPARREILRQQLFRECFAKEHRERRGYRRRWSNLLNQLFDPSKYQERGLTLRLWLIEVESVQQNGRAPISLFVAEEDSRSVTLIYITRRQIEQYIGRDNPENNEHINPHEVSIEPSSDEQHPEDSNTVFELEEHASVSASSTSTPDTRGSDQTVPKEVNLEVIRKQATELKQVLGEYGIKLLDLNPNLTQIGPSVVRYRARLAPGSKLRDVQASAEDVARELSLHSIPIINNIPGEPFVAIDIERIDKEIVPLEAVLAQLPTANPNELVIACGRTPAGQDVQLDIVKLPHLLVAGTTDSGKTMFLCTLLISLLRRYDEFALKLLLIDPKVNNFVFFEGLPHLINRRIYTNALEATEVLEEVLTTELEHRTALLTQGRQSSINNYNTQYPDKYIPRILVVVDEYADLVSVLKKNQRADFENSITRLAQRARSVGIHLALATQRPSVDVVTGNLKANMPCRISFLLPSSIDSRTILDQPGAEHLLGQGDMLLLHNQRLQRLQGYYVADNDIESLIHS